ncbi:MAG: hypothetical protein A2Y62_00305 [Candidatus Fischerbacteria bacterium RBG_13_37_8]|uniref:ABC transporter domain-containing protein n=1 Tax=Candidatus Fischerbacteria bacterium RBG_13_37_8 TaxID=1817863 RepID=A0A1F5VRJ3_9BACT|nr:MAG: hypothetical protein A2Y62_00305 [Candidatus Fischerbacteria bacterium RBG_13_37_8]
MIQIENLDFSYKHTTVLTSINLEIEQGDFLGLIGPNGSGKSTLLKIISGILTPAKGEVLLKQKALSQFDKQELAKIISFLPQDYHPFHDIKVHQVVMLGRIPYFYDRFFENQQDISETQMAMKIAEIDHLSDRTIQELSGGEKQLVYIAKLIAQKTEIMILDEPTTFLDIKHVIQIMNIIKKLNSEESVTVIASMHDLNLAAMYCKKIVMLKKGSVLCTGIPKEVFTYERIKSAFDTEFYIDENDLTGEPIFLPLSPKSRL